MGTRFPTLRLRRTAAALLLLAPAAPLAAAEGMWLPRQAPEVAAAMKAAGLKLDPALLANLQAAPMNAIASLGGCSASFVSPQGLVVSNHHCVYGSIQYNSKPGQDYLTDGFLAKAQADEVPAAPGTRIFVIEDLRDVTAQMTAGVTARLSGFDRDAKLEANRKALIAACEKQPSRRCDVRPYFGGSTYILQQQLEIQDVRLVYAPGRAIGNYGGEIDNWQWPRHTGDFGFYRAYVAPDGASAPYAATNVPYRPKAWLRIAQEALKDGDFVMAAGFPGTTNRHRTAAEAKAFFSRLYPRQQKLTSDYVDQITALTAGDADAAIRYASILRGLANTKKNLGSQLAGAEAIDLQNKKAAHEAAFRAWIAADPKRAAQLGPVVSALDAVAAETVDAAYANLSAGTINRAQLLTAARDLYRWAKERERPDAQREPGFQDRDRRLLTERLRQIERRFAPKVDRGLFEAALVQYRTLAPADRNAGFERVLAEV
ncbi:MAG: S46 family peptidase, partial [Alphaproteobacteria bacterium]|nr:S46 family peptidase [Alphaproteobacteria bacterium]